MYIGKGLIATALILLATPLHAQDDVEYNWEFGAGIGIEKDGNVLEPSLQLYTKKAR